MTTFDELYEKALAATKRPSSFAVQVGGKTVKLIAERVTIYQSSDTFAVYSPIEASSWAVTTTKAPNGSQVLMVLFVRKGKKKIDHSVASVLRQDLLIVKGWGWPQTLYQSYPKALEIVGQAVAQKPASVVMAQQNAPT